MAYGWRPNLSPRPGRADHASRNIVALKPRPSAAKPAKFVSTDPNLAHVGEKPRFPGKDIASQCDRLAGILP
jgi:hypothetical protein